ncbi:alpha-1,6-mannosylglycoprotein 6-beta-N-acetylglucosaminyltransferase B-like [Paramormyrops kingsleyae]|uniref:alpha-1,6-mannosyl-glycoprotein 6-beta-N-acetylglucosaminyltransferase n=1 Tax=Paramormyrops kingsleyae TaxID=1676925 RepID=A0A3B3S4X2_9TELE|nr:alpha-1,6-mannosylglycoprotein 6-beta-N-acetylglucosaminyltransferase B-like [Paramormyrops kingsleyae]XP_023674902.1 alpha-1,6-mannosylglycoprotein 6-beta-N-acetylglucosaminyltransferase B-like [Paramormyrops kingsleyae]
MRVPLRPRSCCVALSLFLLTLMLQSLWVPPQTATGDLRGLAPADQGGPRSRVHRLSLRLDALSSQVQRLSRERGSTPSPQQDLTQLLLRLKDDHGKLVRSMEKELLLMSQKLDRLLQRTPLPAPQEHTPLPALSQVCEVPDHPSFPLCAGKVEFLRASWRSDPCYAFYGVDGSTCSILAYLSEREEFCPLLPGHNRTAPPWKHQPAQEKEKALIRADLSPLYKLMGSGWGPAVKFMWSRIERLAARWTKAGEKVWRKISHRSPSQLRVLLFPGVLAGGGGQSFGEMVERGGPLGELVQWADISAAFFILGHNLTFTVSQGHLLSLIGAAPGRGSCPIQSPIPFDLIYTDYHGLAQLRGVMGLSFQHYQCRFRVLDSFGTEPAFNIGEYARQRGYSTVWGSWGLETQQYMTMFPHTPDNSFMGFVSEDAGHGRQAQPQRKENIAVVYGKQAYMWQGKERYLETISQELEIHGTVFLPEGQPSLLPSFVHNHGLLTQEQLQQLLRRAKLFVGLGFPYEGPAPLEAIALGCVFLQPRFQSPHSSENSNFYKGKPTTRQVHSQHPYAEDFIGKPYVWTVDIDNTTQVREAVKAILSLEVNPFIPHEFTCEGMLERVYAYITHQDFCSTSLPTWPAEGALVVQLAPLGQSCISMCKQTSLVCEPALFHHLNNPAAFKRLGLTCASTEEEVDHLFPAYSPWGRRCSLQKDRLLYSCAGAHPSYRRLCPCRAYQPGQVALCPGCL